MNRAFYQVTFTKGGMEHMVLQTLSKEKAEIEASRVNNFHGNARLVFIEKNGKGDILSLSDALPY